MKNKYLLVIGIVFFGTINFSTKAQNVAPSNSSVDHVVFFIGDAGEPEDNTSDVFDALLRQVKPNEGNSSIVFLGDNIYPAGLPNKGEKGREEAEQIINYQLNRLKTTKAMTYYIPGNHDWDKGSKHGLDYVLNQEKTVEKALGKRGAFVPGNGCPGPVEVSISDNLVLIAMDTQWWLHQYEKGPVKTGDCNSTSPLFIINNLKDILSDNHDKNIIVVGHHPIMSKGNHGGKFNVKDHLFPLTNLNKNLYLPLPIIGSIYPFYRNRIGHIQDIAHPEYQFMINELQAAFDGHDNLVYASGHEHNLEYFSKDNRHYIVSGSGSKTGHTKKLKEPNFSAEQKGFFKITYLKDGSAFMETYGVVDGKEEVLFKKIIAGKKEVKVASTKPVMDEHSEAKTVRARALTDNKSTGFMKRFFLGTHYREAWRAEFDVPVVNVHEEHGGLTPIQKGGGMQTKSLRLEAENGNQYVFRSINKDPSALLAHNLKNTFAADFVKDQITSAHPYSAFVIPTMAEAAGILHAHPKLIVVGDDPHLLQYRKDFANELMLYEGRAANDGSEIEGFGYSSKLVSSPKMIKKVLNDNDYTVDQKELVRNRLFDMFLGDWDRHQDQWRWAEYTCGKEDHSSCNHLPGNETFYIPIPRDRDQAFVKFDGLIPSISNRKWALRQLQTFDYDIRDIKGMNFNGRHLDRSFTTAMSKDDWIAMAKEIQTKLTDDIITDAIKEWPDTIYQLDGEEITAKLISRKNKLQEIAVRYYDVLAKKVDVVGTNKNEYFEVVRVDENITSVKVYKLKGGEKDKMIYHRDFDRRETREISLYGLDGKDVFDISGEAKKGLLVRVIGGAGNDKITDSSQIRGWGKNTKYYDTKKEENKVVCEKKSELKNLTSHQKQVNHFGRQDFKYDTYLPAVIIGSNVDDGLVLGGGMTFIHHGFRKEPYSYKQTFSASRALSANSFNINYAGHFVDFMGKLDLEVDLEVNAPSSTSNFYGYGNESTPFTANGPVDVDSPDFDSDFHLVRFNQVLFQPRLVATLNKFNHIRFGAKYQYIDVKGDKTGDDNAQNTFLTNDDFGAEFASSLESRNYIGGELQYTYDNVDNKIVPTRGISFGVEGSWDFETGDTDLNYGRLASHFSMYIPLPLNLTYGANVKGATLFNDFEFFNAATLGAQNRSGNNGDLRGFRRDRFAGKSSLAINQELRLKLFNIRTYLFPASMGILGFYDVGRVWVDNDQSDVWHNSYGGGIWMNPFEALVINASYAISEEENLLIIKMGFLF